ncbi:MAG: flagellar hook-basal body complex protein [Candidatus Nitrohelix vancouverensis]|uniref:Flagellar hook-basal body complex protein n=1 Tax=Candidatus Nitrohelix vancouverensis TaxID=2705534 RepID=A0A7T0C1A9_9BACT|nr:MAG: flagellar hook-basal body complex protein [Candidatus Nitrohelix vancouverensis]
MINGLFNALSGMNVASRRLQNSSNNLANLQTSGFKKGEVASVENRNGGSSVSAVSKVNSQGPLQQTGNPLNLAINGNGHFQVTRANGAPGFTRAGNFSVDGQGRMVTPNGEPLVPEINIPAGATQISVGSNGQVTARVGGENQILGQIQLSSFNNPEGLTAQGENLFSESAASGAPVAGNPGDGGFGTVLSGVLEMSNVDIAEEMVDQIVSKAAFQANANMVRAADEMLGTILDIKA